MNDDKDPIYTFFPDEEDPNLYAALGVEDKASVDEVCEQLIKSSGAR